MLTSVINSQKYLTLNLRKKPDLLIFLAKSYSTFLHATFFLKVAQKKLPIIVNSITKT